MAEIELVPPSPPRALEWIEPGLREIPGQDPLGLQTITTDRILPALLPGVLALSRRARYFSIYPFLLRRYAEGAGRADNSGLDLFMRQREFELCVAMNMCSRCDADGAIGNRAVRPVVAARPAVYERTVSIQSDLGGYGLYYRSPLEELEVVAIAGRAMLGEDPTPVDLLRRGGRSEGLANGFEHAVADTKWYRRWMHGVDPIPAEVLEELAEAACLCRLDEHPEETAQIRHVLLTAEAEQRAEPTVHRRQAFALLLETISDNAAAAGSDSAFRDAVVIGLGAPRAASGTRRDVYGRWSAVVMRESVQDALSTLWFLFCSAGLRSQRFDGFSRSELDHLIRTRLMPVDHLRLAEREIASSPTTRTSDWIEQVRAAARTMSWEELREIAAVAEDAPTALAVLAELCTRASALAGQNSAWDDVARVDGAAQPGLLQTARSVERMIQTQHTLGDLLKEVISTYVVSVHETVAMSKLPVSTFRFYWEHGRLRFVDNGVWRFDPSGLRRDALATLAHDLGWWRVEGDVAQVTDEGKGVIAAVLTP